MGHLTDFENAESAPIIEPTEEVPAEIDLGNPRHSDCRNFGICRINFNNKAAFTLLPPCCPNRAYGFIRKWEQHGVELILPKAKMAPATMEKHFGSGWFTITDAYELSVDMAQRLGIPGFTFESGRYPVHDGGEKLHVVFG